MNTALKRSILAASTLVCAALLSFSWSDEQGVSFGVKSAQGADRSTEPVRRLHRRSVYEHGLFADAVASTTSPWNYDDYYCYRTPYTGGGYPPGSYYSNSYPGGYCISRGYATGTYAQPMLFPRFYGGGW
jgi:hypothetical protein